MITVAGTQNDPRPQIRTLERFIGRDIPVTVTAFNRDKVAWEVRGAAVQRLPRRLLHRPGRQRLPLLERVRSRGDRPGDRG